MSAPRRLAVAVSVPAVIATGLAVAVPAAAADNGYQGSSFAIKVQVGLAGTELLNQILPDVVSFPSGGEKAVLELPSELSEVATLKVLNAASGVTKDQILASNARTAQLSVLSDLVTASVLNSDCTASNLKLAGDSQVTGLAVGGMKIPIDPGPNFKVEIPTALAPFLSGGIFIDEQDTLPTGDLRVRALHVRLVVDPLGLQTALNGTLGEVRKVAEEVKGAVESATGRSLAALEAQARTARGAVAPLATAATPRTTPAVTEPVDGSRQGLARRNGARTAQREEVRAAVEQRAAHDRLVAQRDAEAAAAEQRAVDAQGRADAAADAAAEASTADATSGEAVEAPAQAPDPSAGQTAVKKSDRAAVSRDAAAASTEAESTPAGTESWQERANRLRPEQAQEAAARAAAEAAEARKAADAAHARAAAARAGQAEPAAASAGNGPAARTDGAAPAPGRAAAVAPSGAQRAGIPIAAAENLGTVGVDVIVSQVTCKGFQAVKAAAKPPARPTDTSSITKPNLPKTGGNGNATVALGATGLGLLLAGSGAVFAVRRRRHSA